MTFIKKINETNIENCKNAASFLQSSMWGEFKSRFGWTAKAFLIEWELGAEQGSRSFDSSPLLLLTRRFAPGFLFAYVPWGPQLPETFPTGGRVQALFELAGKMKTILGKNCVFTRFDPPWYFENSPDLNDEKGAFTSTGFKYAAAAVQAPDTVIIDLQKDCEEILAAMKPKWRYNISLAGKKGVKVTEGGVRDLPVFYTLLKETAARDGIAVHSLEYYKTLFEICEKRNQDGESLSLRLYTASHEDDALAAIVVLFREKIATYLYGASSNVKRNLMAPYALQWRAMRDAKEAGCQWYDLFGIPPDDNPGHPMAGLYRFKTGFGGQIIHRPGSWDFPYKPVLYSLFKLAETFRKRIRDIKKKNHSL